MEDVIAIPSHPIDPAERINALIEEICRALNKHAHGRFISETMVVLIWNRIMRMAMRFASLAARVRSGKLAETAPVRSREAAAPAEGEPGKPRVAPAEVLSRRFGWLVHLLPEAKAYGAGLCWLLQRVEMEELIFAAPQVGRILRPMCRMLGVQPTAALRLPVRARVATSVVATRTEAASERQADGGAVVDGTGEIWNQPPYGFPSAPVEPEVLEFDSKKRA